MGFGQVTADGGGGYFRLASLHKVEFSPHNGISTATRKLSQSFGAKSILHEKFGFGVGRGEGKVEGGERRRGRMIKVLICTGET